MSFFINKPSTMSQFDYDVNKNKKVDVAENADNATNAQNAEKLGGYLPSHFATSDMLGTKILWTENKTVLSGKNTLTLTNPCDDTDTLLVYDNKYGSKWIKGVHWNRSGQIITFTSSMPEDIEFEIINLG